MVRSSRFIVLRGPAATIPALGTAAAARVGLAVAAILALVGLIAPAALPAPFTGSARAAVDWDTSFITHDDGADFRPALHHGRVAWVGQEDGAFGLYTWDSLTETTRLLTTDVDWFERDIVVADDLVIWGAGEDEGASLYCWDAATGTTTTVPGPAGSAVFSDGRYVLWQAQDPSTGFDTEVYLFDSVTGHTDRLTENEDEDVSLGMEGGRALIGRWVGGLVEVVLYDAAAGSSTVVTDAASQGRPPAMGGGWVAWLQPAGDPPSAMSDDLNVMAYEVAGGQMVEVTRRPDDRGLLDLGGGLVAWVEGSGTGVEVYVAALPAGIPMRVSFDSEQSLFPETDGRLVAWSNIGETFRHSRFWAYGEDGTHDLDSPGELTSPPLVSGGRIVWGRGTVDLGGGFLVTQDLMTAVSPLFADVPFTHHYFAPIQGMGERGLIAGYERMDRWADFRPGNPVLRAQFAKMIDGAMRIPVAEEMVSRFTDLGSDDPGDLYPHEYVAAVAEAGITLGTTPTTFSPYKQITRAQVASMVYRAAQSLAPGALQAAPAGYGGTFGNFSADHALAMRTLEYNGLLAGIQGFGIGWSPWAAASRAEVASILWELMKTRATMVEYTS